MAQVGDDDLGCPALKQQIAANSAAMDQLLRKDKQVEQENVVKNVAGAMLVGPLAMGSTDLSNEEQVKARALADRNEHLIYLAKRKGCPS